ncbi:MAG TPA: hypothetical protein VNT30_09535 [Stellaceae bacterium]|nr:hypothetical protein [Stellaceae bacterium]
MTDSDFATGTVLSQNGFCVEIGIGRRPGTQGEGKLRAMISVALDGSELDGLEMAVKRLVPLIVRSLEDIEPGRVSAKVGHSPTAEDTGPAELAATPATDLSEPTEHAGAVDGVTIAEPSAFVADAAPPVVPSLGLGSFELKSLETATLDVTPSEAVFVEAVSAVRVSELSKWAARQAVSVESETQPAPVSGLGGVFARLRGEPEQPSRMPPHQPFTMPELSPLTQPAVEQPVAEASAAMQAFFRRVEAAPHATSSADEAGSSELVPPAPKAIPVEPFHAEAPQAEPMTAEPIRAEPIWASVTPPRAVAAVMSADEAPSRRDDQRKPDSVIAEALSALAEASRAYEATLSSHTKPASMPTQEPVPFPQPSLGGIDQSPATTQASPRALPPHLFGPLPAAPPVPPAAGSPAGAPTPSGQLETLVLTELAPAEALAAAPVPRVSAQPSLAAEALDRLAAQDHPPTAALEAGNRWETSQYPHDFEQPFVLGRLNMAEEAMAIHDFGDAAQNAASAPGRKAKPRRGVFNVLFGRLAAMMFL